MTKLKKVITVFMVVVMLCSVFVGCSKQEKNDNSQNNTQDSQTSKQETETGSKKDVTLKVWGAIGEDKGPGELIEAFMEKNPGIKVEYIMFKNDEAGNTKLNTALIDGADVDVFVNYGVRRLGQRYTDLCEDLGSYIEKDNFNMDDNFNPGHVKFDNKIYGLPANTLKELVYINKNALDEANLPVPDDNWTLADYQRYCEALTKGSDADKRYGSVTGKAGLEWSFLTRGLLGSNFYYKEDGTSNFDHPAFKTALDFAINLETNLKVQENRIEMWAGKINYYSEFLTERTAMVMGADAIMRYMTDLETYPRDWVVTFANYPRFDENTEVNYQKGRNYFDYVSVARNSRNKEEAWKLAKFWATEGSVYLFKYGRVPAWKKTDLEGAIDLVFNEKTKPLIDVEAYKKVVLDFESTGYTDDKLVAYAEIENILITESEKAWVGMQTTEDTVKRMKELADEEIKKASKDN
jgi:multiple sugar transport system substrate-binding protein